MKGKVRLLLGPVMVPLLVAVFFFGGATQSASPASPIKNKVWQAQLNAELGRGTLPHAKVQHLSSGVMYDVLQAAGILDARSLGAPKPPALPDLGKAGTRGCPHTFLGGIGADDVRVNQDCSLRRQAEEVIAVNPTNNKNLIAGQNDSRLGFNQCGIDWSNDGGVTWGDMNPPFHQQLLANGHNLDFCSDPTGVFDTQGNAYFAGLGLSIEGLESAILVARSDAGIDGAFYHIPDTSDPWHQYKNTPLGVVTDEFDETGCSTNDKELMAVDGHIGSPKQDYLYMAWARFDFCTGFGVGAHSPMYFSQSSDGGVTWSTPLEISGSNPTYCTDFSAEQDPNACDQDQGAHPVVGPDGTVYVAFGNGNTPTFGFNQHMVVACAPGNDCSQQSGWSDPMYITDDVGTQPVENNGTNGVSGCPAGRQCLPPNGYRLDDFVHGSLSIDNSGNLYFAWDDFRNGTAPCDTLDYDTATPPCNNDVFYSYSTNGGASWQGPYIITGNAGVTAQWMPWSGVGPQGNNLYIAYYSREFGNCEFDGCNDIVLAKIDHPRSSKIITYTRLTTTSMPNLVIANNPVQAGFLGDYMWVAVDAHSRPYVVWADTRSRGGHIVEEDIRFAS
jgi:hypothetical protein